MTVKTVWGGMLAERGRKRRWQMGNGRHMFRASRHEQRRRSSSRVSD